MSRLLGYMCSDDSLTPYATDEVRRQAWLDEASQAATLGFGWVQESRTLLRKHPSQSNDPVDVLGLLADIPARSIVGHMRENPDAAVDALDLQPFRFRKWVYAQSGNVPRMEAFRDELVAETPDHIRRNIAGKTGAEVVFHRFYYWLKEYNALVPSRLQGERAARAVAATLDEMERRAHEVGFEGPLSVDLVAATERLVVAARLGDPVHYRVFDGIEQPSEEPLFAGHRPKKIKHPHFRGVFVGSNIHPVTDDWRELAERSVMWIDGTWEAKTASLETLLSE